MPDARETRERSFAALFPREQATSAQIRWSWPAGRRQRRRRRPDDHRFVFISATQAPALGRPPPSGGPAWFLADPRSALLAASMKWAAGAPRCRAVNPSGALCGGRRRRAAAPISAGAVASPISRESDVLALAKRSRRPATGGWRTGLVFASGQCPVCARPLAGQNRKTPPGHLKTLASRKGIEPLTPGLGNLCSILLSYRDFYCFQIVSLRPFSSLALHWRLNALGRHPIQLARTKSQRQFSRSPCQGQSPNHHVDLEKGKGMGRSEAHAWVAPLAGDDVNQAHVVVVAEESGCPSPSGSG